MFELAFHSRPQVGSLYTNDGHLADDGDRRRGRYQCQPETACLCSGPWRTGDQSREGNRLSPSMIAHGVSLPVVAGLDTAHRFLAVHHVVPKHRILPVAGIWAGRGPIAWVPSPVSTTAVGAVPRMAVTQLHRQILHGVLQLGDLGCHLTNWGSCCRRCCDVAYRRDDVLDASSASASRVLWGCDARRGWMLVGSRLHQMVRTNLLGRGGPTKPCRWRSLWLSSVSRSGWQREGT